jgi:two-component system alkaline phosphatase synthesis response regulator PhoP
MRGRRILLVDDDVDFVDVISHDIRDGGYEVDIAYNGKDALELARNQTYGLVLLDVMMPELDGYQVCEAIRSIERNSDVPVVMLTAVADHVTSTRYSHRDMLESESDDYFAKPVSPKELLERIEHWFRLQEQAKA